MPTFGEDRANLRTLTCTLHDSLDAIAPADWLAIVDESTDLAMDRRLISVQQRALADQCRMWFAVVRDAFERPLAVACLCLFKVDGVISAHPFLQHAAALARRVRPGMLRFGVLFCGLPVPAGESHLRVAPHADVSEVMACLHARMRELARKHRAALLVFKEFDAARADIADAMRRHGYQAGGVPCMYHLRGAHADFGSFLAAMRSRYRAQVLRSRRKIDANGFAIEHHTDSTAIIRAFTDEAHALYEAVWRRSQYKLERLSREFFLAAAAVLPGEAALTVIRRRFGPIVGFAFSVSRGRRWHNLYSGVDYSINGEGDILFNLFYADLALAFERGCDDIMLGQTSDEFKARLGAVAQPLRFFVQARSSIVHAGLRAMAPVVFPSAPAAPIAHVFRARATDGAPVASPIDRDARIATAVAAP